MPNTILVVTTGGTIDKKYPEKVGAYAFEIGEPAVIRVCERLRRSLGIRIHSLCKKDSQDLNPDDLDTLLQFCITAPENLILITHGTDTILQTAQKLSIISTKRIVLTGAFLPESVKNSDADAAVGFALGCLTQNNTPGIFLAFHGQLFSWNKVKRNTETGNFEAF